MNTENSKTNEPLRFRLSLVNKRNLKDPNKNMALANLSIYYISKNIKSAYKRNNCKISAPTWNNEFDLPVDQILLQTSKTTLKLSLNNTKL